MEQAQRVNQKPTQDDIKAWLIAHMSQVLEIDPNSIDVNAPFDQFGIDSVTAVGMSGELEKWIGRSLDPTLLYEHPTIETVSHYLVQNND